MKGGAAGTMAAVALAFLAAVALVANADHESAKYSPAPAYTQPGYVDPPYAYKPKEPEILVCVARAPTLLSAYPAEKSISVKLQTPANVCEQPEKIVVHVVPVHSCGYEYCRVPGARDTLKEVPPLVKEVFIDHLESGTQFEVTAFAVYKQLGTSPKSNKLLARTLDDKSYTEPLYKPPVKHEDPYRPPDYHQPSPYGAEPLYKPPVKHEDLYRPPDYHQPSPSPYGAEPPVVPLHKPPVKHDPYSYSPAKPPTKGYNDHGYGPAPAPYHPPSCHAPGRPLHVEAVGCGRESIKVSWLAPLSTGGCGLTKYKVQVNVCHDNEHRLLDKYGHITKKLESRKLHATVEHLIPGVHYCVTVTAVNSKHLEGPPSKVATSKTAIPGFSRPSPPVGLVAKPIETHTVKLTFDPPKCDGGCYIEYFVVVIERLDHEYHRIGESALAVEAEYGEDAWILEEVDGADEDSNENARLLGLLLAHKLKDLYTDDHKIEKFKYEEPKHYIPHAPSYPPKKHEEPKYHSPDPYSKPPSHGYEPKAPSYPSKAPSYPKAPSPGKGKGKFGKISLIVNDLMPHVRYRFSVKTKTLCSQHPLVFKVSHPSNSAIATTCYPYESHKCVSCSCKALEHCEHC